jgi:hypothetical protein
MLSNVRHSSFLTSLPKNKCPLLSFLETDNLTICLALPNMHKAGCKAELEFKPDEIYGGFLATTDHITPSAADWWLSWQAVADDLAVMDELAIGICTSFRYWMMTSLTDCGRSFGKKYL